MKIFLVKPNNQSDHIQPSLGLGYLATALRKDHEVRILDCIKDRVSARKLAGMIRGAKPDIIGFQCYTFDLPFIKEALGRIKELDKGIITVVGGPHPSAMPKETLQMFRGSLDFAFVGESEESMPLFAKAIVSDNKDFSSVPGLVWRDKKDITINPRSFIEDLDSLGMPAWDMIRPDRYPEAQHGAFFRQFPISPVMITRGCAYPCTFCAGHVISGRKVRRRSADSVIKELLHLRREFGIKEFHVIDDNFTFDKAFAKDLLKKIKALELGLSWAVPNGVRMDTLDEELLALMKETGLYLISLGIESGSDEILKAMKKGITTTRIRQCVKRINDAGIDIAGFFILGFPGETEETIRQTIRFSTELKLVRANYFTYLPFPGSESYNELANSGELKGVDWDNFSFTAASYTSKGFSRKKLKKLQRLAFAKFYLRPSVLFYNIMSVKSLRHFFFLAQRFFRWIIKW